MDCQTSHRPRSAIGKRHDGLFYDHHSGHPGERTTVENPSPGSVVPLPGQVPPRRAVGITIQQFVGELVQALGEETGTSVQAQKRCIQSFGTWQWHQELRQVPCPPWEVRSRDLTKFAGTGHWTLPPPKQIAIPKSFATSS
ncbi:hypothetical protein PGTUg99_012896 [Puccinia graminis f. sp. tritici]|uniref:Uncharacterized protein n=1 Tax=Puccinia graminis f. sp. tritici TaxID=56615 RepID=A0A5B0SHW0_PUCGR|nr:hypothetical protein PGTUg99_012896 [Puccinia graminis f. sp. tritici]